MKIDPQLEKFLARHAPLTTAMFLGRKYLVPNYRLKDYALLEYWNHLDFCNVINLACGTLSNEPHRRAAEIMIAALECNRPTLYLERELGEALLRTEILSDLNVGDIHWRWPAFRIVLPLGLLSLRYNDSINSLAYFDVSRVGRTHPFRCPLALARELDALAAKGKRQSTEYLQHLVFGKDRDEGIGIAAMFVQPETIKQERSPAIFVTVKPWGNIRVSDYQADLGELYIDSPDSVSPDSLDREVSRRFENRLEHLVLNVLLFLSAFPLEYQSEHIIRRPHKEGSRLIPGLVAARFVGQEQIRPRHERPSSDGLSYSTGRHLAAHWRCGTWKRQPCGPRWQERKIIWIKPYRTHGFVELAKEQSMSHDVNTKVPIIPTGHA